MPDSYSAALKEAAITGEQFVAAEERPDDDSHGFIPGELIRDLLMGESSAMHWKGLRARGLYIRGDIDLTNLVWAGSLELTHCYVEGSVKLTGAKLTGKVSLARCSVRGVEALGAVVDGSLICKGLRVTNAGFYAVGITVTAALNLSESDLTAPIDSPGRSALSLYRAKLGDVFLGGATLRGGGYLSGIRVGRNIRLQGLTACTRADLGWKDAADTRNALALTNSTTEGAIYFSHVQSSTPLNIRGNVSLVGAECRQLSLRTAEVEDVSFTLDDFRYERLSVATPGEFFTFLQHDDHFSSQQLIHFASYCEKIGDLTLKTRALLYLERRTTDLQSRRNIIYYRRKLFEVVAGYGYKPLRTVIGLALAVVLGIVLLRYGTPFLVPKTDGATAPNATPVDWPHSVTLTLDNLLPFASLGVMDQWRVQTDSAASVAALLGFMVLKFITWALAAVVLASFTGLFKKRT